MQPKGILEQEVPPEEMQAEPPEMEAEEGVEEGAEGEADPSTDPAYSKAMDMVMGKLYDEDIADGIAQAINSSQDKATAIAEQAGVLLGLADDMTEGSVPDELYIAFALDILTEVVEIAQAAGAQIAGKDIAVAAREFITATVEGIGGDLTDIKAAMGQINPDELGASLDQVEG
ncbi:MAG: hypothetical protein RL299_205 [Pseudomonadota bacterium]|jgi:hypothetical protein